MKGHAELWIGKELMCRFYFRSKTQKDWAVQVLRQIVKLSTLYDYQIILTIKSIL